MQVREHENERLQKWIKMMKQWEKYSGTDKLRRRVYKGIPNALRGEFWARLLNVANIKREQEGKYWEMRERARLWSPDIRQIDLDVNRTYRNHIMFRERYNVKQQSLFNVLAAYSIYNTEVGYCQGMSQIAALLLMFMNEEDSFWALSLLMSDQKHAMHGFFIPGFPKLKRFQDHHDKILQKFLPRVKKHLDKFNIPSSLYTLKWFFQCFLDRVPFSLTLRLWDVYMMEGEPVLTAMSYNLLRLHKKSILKMDMEALIEFLQVRLEHDFGYHDDAAIESLQTAMDELRRAKMAIPGQAPAPEEFPQRPFGMPLPHEQKYSVRVNGSLVATPVWKVRRLQSQDLEVASSVAEDGLRSTAGSARTSKTSTDDLSSLATDATATPRRLSLYDNVDYQDSIRAASRQSPDAIRIFVPYTPPSTLPRSSDPNKITIRLSYNNNNNNSSSTPSSPN
ncbi:RN-tre [Cordylochernes scorpioides]|uniref:RN-tre n=1 Tax=Cordylochernes scorpioides TaxID=51811 RepID=A0ABY6KLX6_9ARAC|nr:RN-tre [Cordylochernes scorpioides]